MKNVIFSLLILFFISCDNSLQTDISNVDFCKKIENRNYEILNIEALEFEDTIWYGTSLIIDGNIHIYIESYFKDFSHIFRLKVLESNYNFKGLKVNSIYDESKLKNEKHFVTEDLGQKSIYLPKYHLWINLDNHGQNDIINSFTLSVDCHATSR